MKNYLINSEKQCQFLSQVNVIHRYNTDSGLFVSLSRWCLLYWTHASWKYVLWCCISWIPWYFLGTSITLPLNCIYILFTVWKKKNCILLGIWKIKVKRYHLSLLMTLPSSLLTQPVTHCAHLPRDSLTYCWYLLIIVFLFVFWRGIFAALSTTKQRKRYRVSMRSHASSTRIIAAVLAFGAAFVICVHPNVQPKLNCFCQFS